MPFTLMTEGGPRVCHSIEEIERLASSLMDAAQRKDFGDVVMISVKLRTLMTEARSAYQEGASPLSRRGVSSSSEGSPA